MKIFYGSRHGVVPAVCDALACPTRRDILFLAANYTCGVNDIAGALGRSPSTISHHLHVLEAADLIVRWSWEGASGIDTKVDNIHVLVDFLWDHYLLKPSGGKAHLRGCGW
ncbi:MAG: winged helix-turn-helix transcriptional regulator [Coriobacteriales bacterium]|nr:winged helix-turn-helix transcriptional regulator [Coriobacteriales bacterium]